MGMVDTVKFLRGLNGGLDAYVSKREIYLIQKKIQLTCKYFVTHFCLCELFDFRCGIRAFVGIKLFCYLKHQAPHTAPSHVSSADAFWALHSESQEALLEMALNNRSVTRKCLFTCATSIFDSISAFD